MGMSWGIRQNLPDRGHKAVRPLYPFSVRYYVFVLSLLSYPITEEMKARDQMELVRAVNNIRNVAEEIVLKELVYI